MYNLNDILASAQNGAFFDNLARQYGVSAEQAQTVVKAMIPQFSAAMLQPGALASVFEGMTRSSIQQAFQNAAAVQTALTTQQGGTILDQIFGNAALTKEISDQIAARTGLKPDLVAQMIPAIASVALGGLYHALQNQGLGGLFGPFGSMFGQGAGQAGAAKPGSETAGPAAGMPMGNLGDLMGTLWSTFLGRGASGAAAPASVVPGLEALEKMLQPGMQIAAQHQAEIQEMLKKIVAARN
jgi:hypothetical protein